MKKLSASEMLRMMNDTDDKLEYIKIRVLYLRIVGKKSFTEIAKLVDRSKEVLAQWLYKYRHGGWEALRGNFGKGIRRNHYMSHEEEAELLRLSEDDAQKGNIKTAQYIKEKVEEKLGHKVSHVYVYSLMGRHGWRKVAPRPEHPKSSSKKKMHLKMVSLKP